MLESPTIVDHAVATITEAITGHLESCGIPHTAETRIRGATFVIIRLKNPADTVLGIVFRIKESCPGLLFEAAVAPLREHGDSFKYEGDLETVIEWGKTYLTTT